jgi:hypothetical protein
MIINEKFTTPLQLRRDMLVPCSVYDQQFISSFFFDCIDDDNDCIMRFLMKNAFKIYLLMNCFVISLTTCYVKLFFKVLTICYFFKQILTIYVNVVLRCVIVLSSIFLTFHLLFLSFSCCPFSPSNFSFS